MLQAMSFACQAAKDIVLAQKPVISNDTGSLEPLLLDELLLQMSTLASVYHKPAGTFISRTRLAVKKADEMESTHFEDELTPAPEEQERTREVSCIICKKGIPMH